MPAMLNYRITKDNQIKNSVKRDFSSGSVVESLPAMQGSWVCFLTREIPHAVEQLSPCSTTREAEAVRSPGVAGREQPLLTAAREKPAQQWRPSTARNK